MNLLNIRSHWQAFVKLRTCSSNVIMMPICWYCVRMILCHNIIYYFSQGDISKNAIAQKRVLSHTFILWFFTVVPRGQSPLSRHTCHSCWYQTWSERRKRNCRKVTGEETCSTDIPAGMKNNFLLDELINFRF